MDEAADKKGSSKKKTISIDLPIESISHGLGTDDLNGCTEMEVRKRQIKINVYPKHILPQKIPLKNLLKLSINKTKEMLLYSAK